MESLVSVLLFRKKKYEVRVQISLLSFAIPVTDDVSVRSCQWVRRLTIWILHQSFLWATIVEWADIAMLFLCPPNFFPFNPRDTLLFSARVTVVKKSRTSAAIDCESAPNLCRQRRIYFWRCWEQIALCCAQTVCVRWCLFHVIFVPTSLFAGWQSKWRKETAEQKTPKTKFDHLSWQPASAHLICFSCSSSLMWKGTPHELQCYLCRRCRFGPGSCTSRASHAKFSPEYWPHTSKQAGLKTSRCSSKHDCMLGADAGIVPDRSSFEAKTKTDLCSCIRQLSWQQKCCWGD